MYSRELHLKNFAVSSVTETHLLPIGLTAYQLLESSKTTT